MGRQTITFAGLRAQCPTPTIAAASGGNLSAGSLWLSCIALNRVGLNRAATLQQITWTDGQKLQITLPLPDRAAAEDIHRIIIAGSATNNATSLQPLCWWRGYTLNSLGSGYFEEVQAPLPATIELAQPAHIALGAVVPNPAALTALAQLLDGMCRWVTSLSKLFYYDALSSATANGTTVIASSSTGRWLPWILPDTFGVGSITDVTGERGCLRDARSLTDADVLFPPPSYAMNGSRGGYCTYWVANGVSESGTDIEAGKRVSLEVSQNGMPKSQLFDQRLVARMAGIVRLSDGSLTTTGLNTGQTDYSYGNPVYTLEQNLQPGRAIALQIAPRFRQEELDGYLQASPIEIKPYFMPQAGSYVTGYRLWGDVIYAIGNRRRVFPRVGANLRVGDGSGLIQRFEFELKPSLDLTLPGANLVNQKITVNSNGDVFFRGTTTNDPTEVTRAIVTMGSGRSNASAQSAYLTAAANDALNVTVPYPTTIRADLGDAIAGAGAAAGAELNAPFVVFYVQRQSDGQIREFIGNAVVPGANQLFQITSFTAGTTIGSIPAAVAGNFGFWESSAAPTVALGVGLGSLAAGSYRVSWAFRYDGSTASSISHAVSNGCVPEMDGQIGQLFSTIAQLNATLQGFQNGTANLDVLNAVLRGDVDLRGNVDLRADEFDLNADAAGTGADWKYTLRRPTTGMSAAQTLTLPPSPGQAGQALVGDGAGGLQYASVSRTAQIALAHNSANILNWFTLPAGAYLQLIEFFLISQFSGTAVFVSVGISIQNTKYIASTALDLKATNSTRFRFYSQYAPPVAAEPIIITYTAASSGGGSGSGIFIAHYSI